MSDDKIDTEHLSPHLVNKINRSLARSSQNTRRTFVSKAKEGDFAGVIQSVHGKIVTVESHDGKRLKCFLRGTFKKRLVVGDRVSWSFADKKNGVICSLLERKNILKRNDPMGEPKEFAANIDVMVIVSSVKPAFREGLIDRYLVEAESQNMEAVMLLNKVDLKGSEVIEKKTLVYKEIGYQTYFVSASTRLGMDNFYQSLSDKVSILVGYSGVGKTSILNILIPDANLKVSSIHEPSGQGRHTTSASRMYTLSNGAKIIDSPGVRTFGLSPSFKKNIAPYFRDFRRFASECEFDDCSHIKEVNCAVKEALDEGKIHMARYESYLSIVESMKN